MSWSTSSPVLSQAILCIALNFSIIDLPAAQNDAVRFENKAEKWIAKLKQALTNANTKSGQSAAEELVAMGRAAIEPVSEALRTAEDPSMRIVLVGVLGEIGGEEVVQPIIKTLRNRNARVGSTVAILLSRMSRPPNLIDLLVT